MYIASVLAVESQVASISSQQLSHDAFIESIFVLCPRSSLEKLCDQFKTFGL